MPEITRLEEREGQILAKLRSRGRLEGRHLTDAVYCNVKAWGQARLAALGQTPPHDDATLLRFLRGNWREALLAEGEMAQMETISQDDDSVGTIDIWRACAVESKSTETSVRRDIGDMDHWMLQLGGYVARNIREGAKTARGELWVIYERGDHGKKRCAKHGVPDREFKRRYEETGRQRLACPVDGCWDFLEDGDRDPMLRCFQVRWTREELASLHRILTWRQAQLKGDIENAEYGIGSPPPIAWGYDFECDGCPVKDRIGCPGRGVADDLEAQLQGSILELEERRKVEVSA